MTGTGPLVTLSPKDWDAALFDMDGVLTRTADVHARAWKKLFDNFLARHAQQSGMPFTSFDMEVDYRRYVDGKPRYDGVISFLASRGIALPLDAPPETPDAPSVHRLGAQKDQYFLDALRQRGVKTYEAAVELVRTLREHHIRTAVVTSSLNGKLVLEKAGIAHLFDTRRWKRPRKARAARKARTGCISRGRSACAGGATARGGDRRCDCGGTGRPRGRVWSDRWCRSHWTIAGAARGRRARGCRDGHGAPGWPSDHRESQNFDVTLADNGATAWTMIEECSPDLIVTDYQMPG